jgi:tripartite-type tricarboxylate transporter receptor subunit TctC
VTSTVRLPDFPNTPTLAEQGVTNYSYTTYGGLFAPAGTPKEVVARLERALLTVTTSEAFKERCRIDGSLPLPLGSDAFEQRVRNDTEKVAKMVAEMGLPKQ